jgi:hypothetical protein
MTPSMTPGLKPAASSLPCRSRISSGVSSAALSGVGLSNCCGTGGDETDGEETGADETDAGASAFRRTSSSLVASAFGRARATAYSRTALRVWRPMVPSMAPGLKPAALSLPLQLANFVGRQRHGTGLRGRWHLQCRRGDWGPRRRGDRRRGGRSRRSRRRGDECRSGRRRGNRRRNFCFRLARGRDASFRLFGKAGWQQLRGLKRQTPDGQNGDAYEEQQQETRPNMTGAAGGEQRKGGMACRFLAMAARRRRRCGKSLGSRRKLRRERRVPVAIGRRRWQGCFIV